MKSTIFLQFFSDLIFVHSPMQLPRQSIIAPGHYCLSIAATSACFVCMRIRICMYVCRRRSSMLSRLSIQIFLFNFFFLSLFAFKNFFFHFARLHAHTFFSQFFSFAAVQKQKQPVEVIARKTNQAGHQHAMNAQPRLRLCLLHCCTFV